MYYAALQAAGLIRASVSCGACVGNSEAGFHLGSMPCGYPGLSSQDMNWRRSGGTRNTEEVPGASGRPTRAVHHLCLRSDFHWCSVKLGTKQIAETFLLFVGHTPPCFPWHCQGLCLGAAQEEGRQALKAAPSPTAWQARLPFACTAPGKRKCLRDWLICFAEAPLWTFGWISGPTSQPQSPCFACCCFFIWGQWKFVISLSFHLYVAGCHSKTSHSAVLLLSKWLNVFFPIASLMGRDNGSGMLSAHAGDASAFVQHTCVVGTRPLCPPRASAWQRRSASAPAPCPCRTRGSAPSKSVPESPGDPWTVSICSGCRWSRPEPHTPSTNRQGQASFLWTPVAFCRGAGSGTPHGRLFCVLDTQLWLTHSFTSLSAYPETEVRRLCVIRK